MKLHLRLPTVGMISIVAMSMFGCSGDTGGAPVQAGATSCGITQIDTDQKGFWFSCGLPKADIHPIETAEGIGFPESQLCDVSFDSTGAPKQFRCSENPTPIEAYIASGVNLAGAWSCSVRDATFQITFESTGDYTQIYPASSKSDSIWSRASTQIGGGWSFGKNTNRLRITPVSATSDLIRAAGADYSEVPSYLKRHQEWTINYLTRSALEAYRKDIEQPSRYLSPVKCKSIKSELAANN